MNNDINFKMSKAGTARKLVRHSKRKALKKLLRGYKGWVTDTKYFHSSNNGLCVYLAFLALETSPFPNNPYIHYLYKILVKHKPKSVTDGYWWYPVIAKKRIEFLERLIKHYT